MMTEARLTTQVKKFPKISPGELHQWFSSK